ncbi:MAG: hypothetical protein HZC36_02135 [Armatimonadetes bacterium]|nr:hypothetical protein [Armatimonadota bacterium]
MTPARMLKVVRWPLLALPSVAAAQIPDMVTAFDAGGRAMGAGSSFYATGADSISAVTNPAGLAYARSKTFQIAARNFPKSKSTVTGSLTDLRYDTSNEAGDRALSHIGAVFPLQSQGGSDRGTFSIAYTVTGWFNDVSRGSNLTGGIANYLDFTRAKTSLLSFSYGRAVGDSGLSFGIGGIYAIQNVRNFQNITFTDNNIPPQTNNSDQTGGGLGAVAGLLFTPPSQPNLSFGASVQMPINVRSNAAALGLYHKIPGRFTLGASMANDGLRGGKDSLIFGAQVDMFFDGNDSDRIDRKSNYTSFGTGVEYIYARGVGVFPIRLGYHLTPAGGDHFTRRSGLTYGIGYRPNEGNWTLDLNFARPNGGGIDTSLLFGYRFGG